MRIFKKNLKYKYWSYKGDYGNNRGDMYKNYTRIQPQALLMLKKGLVTKHNKNQQMVSFNSYRNIVQEVYIFVMQTRKWALDC